MAPSLQEPLLTASPSPLARFEERFYDLHTGVVGDHERPHKPVMLLAVTDLIGSGAITENLIPFSKALRDRFAEYIEIVRAADDQNSPENPFFYLRSETFWHHRATEGNERLVGELSAPPSIGQIPRLIAGATLDEPLFELFKNPTHRAVLRDILISRYFPAQRQQIESIAAVRPVLREAAPSSEQTVQARCRGFCKIVVAVYEHQCAACGLRIRLAGGQTIVDAAHLIPFAESQDDHPRNGMALCKNHHWAMDSRLIAPGPDHLWDISSELDDRQSGERDLLQLKGRRLILPKEPAYHPRPDALAWRIQQLSA